MESKYTGFHVNFRAFFVDEINGGTTGFGGAEFDLKGVFDCSSRQGLAECQASRLFAQFRWRIDQAWTGVSHEQYSPTARYFA